jgi:FkbM family methyltransferase
MLQPKKNAFVLVSTDLGSMIVNRLDYQITDGYAWGVGNDLMETSTFDVEYLSSLCQILDFRRQHYGDGVMAVDCGANIGTHTLAYARHMTGWGEVLAIEAQERIFYALTGNIALNNHFNARGIWAAISDSPGVMEIPCVDYLRPTSFGSVELEERQNRNELIGQELDYTPGRGQRVQTITLDQLNLTRVDLLKIDVEGMEAKVFRGGAATIGKCKPVIFAEHIKSDFAEIVAFVKSANYNVMQVRNNLICTHRDDPISQSVSVT